MSLPPEEFDAVEFIQGNKPCVAEAVLAAILDGQVGVAHEIAAKKGWPNGVVETLHAQIQAARDVDEPMPDDGDPEEFLMYARGTGQAGRHGYVATETFNMLSDRVGTLSQCRACALWLVEEYRGHPLEPTPLAVSALAQHSQDNPDAQYLVRYRSFVWVARVMNQKIVGPQELGFKFLAFDQLEQVWLLSPLSAVM